MKSIKTGGPAFPSDKGGVKFDCYHEPHPCPTPGMTLRDWFAGMALQGLLASGNLTSCDGDAVTSGHNELTRRRVWRGDGEKATWEDAAIGLAWECADCMIAERDGKEDA